MIPSRMQTGFAPVEEPSRPDPDQMIKVKCLMVAFLEKATTFAAVYAKEAGRNTVTANDVKYAMQYLAHEFFESPDLFDHVSENMDAYNDTATMKALEAYTEVMEASTDEEDDLDSGSDSETASNASSEDAFTEVAHSTNPIVIKMNQYHREWDSWEPTDEVQRSMKNAIDRLPTEDDSTVA